MNKLTVRNIREPDFETIVGYFLNAEPDFLHEMGVDPAKLSRKEDWLKLLSDDFKNKPEEKKFYYVIWLLDDVPVGHSNINQIIYGEHATMHLHLWDNGRRKKGSGLEFIKLPIPRYFDTFKLKNLFCEPYALNPAPNKILDKAGFTLIKKYNTTHGPINFPQSVNRWCMNFNNYKKRKMTYT